ncbi:MAG: glycosyltransferase family 2 protein [Bacteroidia bacterium]
MNYKSILKTVKRRITHRLEVMFVKMGNPFLTDNSKIAICLICKDENQYLQEWLDYHRSIGFKHFFIYDNNSKIPISQTLHDDDCTVIVWKEDKVGKQANAYLNCCQNNKQYSWILFIDTDEFLILKKHKTVQEFLNGYKRFKAVGLNWICYTASGHENRVEWFKYDKYIPLNTRENQHIKSFVRPQFVVVPPPDPHKFLVETVNEHKDLINGPLHKHSSDIAYIRHNITRSKNEYIEKINRGRGDGMPTGHTLDLFYDLEKQSI